MPRRSRPQPVRSRPRLPARPRKSLGQHFLTDPSILDRIVHESDVGSEDTVIEIGPGSGELTERLVQVARCVIAVEIDETLARHVQRRLATAENLRVLRTDVLDHTPAELLAEGDASLPYGRTAVRPYQLIANIPYYITAPILRTFLETPDQPRQMTLMMQKEVAESLVARPGKMSLLGVSVQFYGDARLLFVVPPEAFYPPPKVASAVVHIDVRDRPAVDVPDVSFFFDVVRAGFSQPRKQLHNALAGRLWLPPDSAPDLLRAAGVDPMRRAQTLYLEEWAAVAEAVASVQATARETGAQPHLSKDHSDAAPA